MATPITRQGQQRKASAPTTMPPRASAPSLPFAPGQPVILSSDERQQLSMIGIKEGDPIPHDLADRVAEMARIAKAEARTVQSPVPLNHPPLQMPAEVSVNSLPDEERREIMEYVKQYGSKMAERRKLEELTVPGASKEVNEAIMRQAELQMREDVSSKLQSARNQVAATMARDPDREITAESLARSVQAGAPPTKEESPAEATDPQKDALEKALTKVVVTDADISDTILAMETGTRFRRSFEFFGGRVVVGFKDLIPYEMDEIYEYSVAESKEEIRKSGNNFPVSSALHADLYRVFMSLDFVRVNGADKSLIDYTKWKEKNPAGSVRQYYQSARDFIASTDTMLSLVNKGYEKFALLKLKIDKEFSDPNEQ